MRKSKVPHHGGDFRFVHQPVSHRYRLFLFARVIPLHQHNFSPLMPPAALISATACEQCGRRRQRWGW